MEQDQSRSSDTSANDENEWIQAGTHHLRIMSSDMIVMRARGDVTRQDARSIFDKLTSWPRPEQGFFVLVNVSQLRHHSQQALGELSSVPMTLFRAVAVVGATFRHRVLIDTSLRAARYFNINVFTTRTGYINTEEEALGWFERLRRGED